MKFLFLPITICVLLLSCQEKTSKQQKTTPPATQKVASSATTYTAYGKKITDDAALNAATFKQKIEALEKNDTLTAKVSASIKKVCVKKGCWMTLDLGQDQEVRVTFKDYGFFVPLDAKGDAIIEGKAFVKETSIDELKHFAQDAGKPESEIAKILAPKKTYAFVADGVLLKI